MNTPAVVRKTTIYNNDFIGHRMISPLRRDRQNDQFPAPA